MKFKKYTIPIYSRDHTKFITNIEYIIPYYTRAEIDEIINYVKAHNYNTNAMVMYGEGDNEGELTEFGEYLLSVFGHNYYRYGFGIPHIGLDTYVWYNAITKLFPNRLDLTGEFLDQFDDIETLTGRIRRLTSIKVGQTFYDSGFLQFKASPYYGDGNEMFVEVNNTQYRNSLSWELKTSGSTKYGYFRGSPMWAEVDDGTWFFCSGITGHYNTSPEGLYASMFTSISSEDDIKRGHPELYAIFYQSSDYEIVDESELDPYTDGGTSGTGGGTGTFSDTGDAVDFPSLPTLSAVDTGFITLYNPTLAQMQELSSYMWSDLFDLDTFRKIVADPMDAMLGLSIVPVAVPDGGIYPVTVGNISTGVNMTRAGSQYVEVDCGSLNIKEFWGAYLDYDPFTKAELYLPYCGTHAIAVDDIMSKTVHIKYHVDILSGACCCYVKCGESVLYTFVGQCSSSIPISAGDYTNVINGIITVAASVGSLVATGGASAPTAIPALASTAVNSMKPTIEKSGSMSGTGGMLAVQTPYLIVTRPKQALPTDQNTFTGYPSFINEKLSDLSGFTQIEEIRLTEMSASDAEISEIETLLKTGVIF